MLRMTQWRLTTRKASKITAHGNYAWGCILAFSAHVLAVGNADFGMRSMPYAARGTPTLKAFNNKSQGKRA